MTGAALLLSHLHYGVVPVGGEDHRITFDNAVGDRFFHIDRFAGGTGVYELKAVPVIGCPDDHNVYILPIQ